MLSVGGTTEGGDELKHDIRDRGFHVLPLSVVLAAGECDRLQHVTAVMQQSINCWTQQWFE